MRSFPAVSDYGTWDVLPEPPSAAELDMSNPDVADAWRRRVNLVEQWQSLYHYPHGTWREDSIAGHPEQAQAWREWLLRRSWEGITIIDGSLRRWSQAPVRRGA